MGLRRGGGAALKLSARQIGELVEELGELIVSWRVRDVEPHPPRDLILVLEPPPGSAALPPIRRLLLSAHPEAARFHLLRARLKRHEGPSAPFFQHVARELVGARCACLTQIGCDRLLQLELLECAEGGRRSLLLELTGRHANLLLLAADERVLDWIVPVPEGKAAARLVLGQIWRPPGGEARAPSGAAGPSIEEAFPAPKVAPPGQDGGLAPRSWLVECALGAQAEAAWASEQRARLEARLARRIDRAEKLLAGLYARAAACAEVERIVQDGELLKSNLASVQRGQTSLSVTDWFSAAGAMREIALDPKLNARENLTRIFERAKKLERAREGVAQEIADTKRRLGDLRELAARAAAEASDADALEAEAIARHLLEAAQIADPRKKPRATPRVPYRSFVGLRGSEIRVGRSAKDNDELTARHSRGSDLWLHTADAPGSHVVLRLQKGATPDEEELLDAAHLAVHYSPLRGAARALVHVALRKQVHKPRGAKAGLVTLSGGKTLTLRLQPERLDRLLHSHRREADGSEP